MPKIIDHNQRREEIAQQVNSLISEKGIESTTIRAICRRSGFSTGVLAHYFENREAMLIYVFEWHMRHVYKRLESLENIETIDGSVLLTRAVEMLLPGYDGGPGDEEIIFSAGLWTFMQSDEHRKKLLINSYKPIVTVLENILIGLNITPDHAGVKASLLQATIDGLWIHCDAGLIAKASVQSLVEDIVASTLIPRNKPAK
jgi:AcrR family transcriptional regulator